MAGPREEDERKKERKGEERARERESERARTREEEQHGSERKKERSGPGKQEASRNAFALLARYKYATEGKEPTTPAPAATA